mgnify:FL=1
MRIHLLAVGRRMPGWVEAGVAEYLKRFPPECSLQIQEVEPARRSKNTSPDRCKSEEADRLLAAVPKGANIIALDERGKSPGSHDLAGWLGQWLQDGRDIALMVGGADGLDARCLQAASQRWSLSPLTLPHGMVRVLVAEQLYRAVTILAGHPYHRD